MAMLCFTFNVFAFDMPIVTGNPEIIIDGKGLESVWIESGRAELSASSHVADVAYVEVFCYQNTMYGLVSFKNAAESCDNLVVKVEFKHEGKSAHVIFAVSDQSVICSENNIVVEGAVNKINKSYFMEFSFTAKQGSLAQGDLVELNVYYSDAEQQDSYDNLYGLVDGGSYEYYVGGKLPDKVTTNKTQSGNSTSKTTKPAKTTVATIDDTTTAIDVDSFINIGYTDTTETTVIITVMTIVCIIMIIIMTVLRRPENKSTKYTDDDKGCD
ncbi:MAG: hypothetical protein IKY44_01675 [Clostridia bacterium]|nr:hypothetical protein [Clostridia bacterium]